MQSNAIALEAVPTLLDHLCEGCVKWICKHSMADDATLKESEWPYAFRPVDDLVRDNKVSGLDLLLQAAYGREGDYCPHANRSKRRDVRPRRALMRRELVMNAMSCQKSYRRGFGRAWGSVVKDGNGRRWCAPSVTTFMVATCEKPGRVSMPVPPMQAIVTGSACIRPYHRGRFRVIPLYSDATEDIFRQADTDKRQVSNTSPSQAVPQGVSVFLKSFQQVSNAVRGWRLKKEVLIMALY
ncbi:hypothetical protein MRB53_042162 [Persea americana]|nr:hypothetical protein MRB53_042162 [Persea americana]